MAQPIRCSACLEDITYQIGQALVVIEFRIPGKEPREITPLVCFKCSKDYKNESKMPVIEALCTANIQRQMDAETSFTPTERGDE